MTRAFSLKIAVLAACVSALLVPGTILVGEAAAQPDNANIRSHKQRAPHRTAPQSQPQHYQRGQRTARPYVNSGIAERRLIGSAADVRSRRYQRYLNQPTVKGGVSVGGHYGGGHYSGGHYGGGHGGHYGGGHYGGGYYGGYSFGAPYVVYIDPSPREPQVVEEPPPRYEPPPIYIVQPQPVPVQPAAPTWQPAAPAPVQPQEPATPRRPRSTEPQAISMSVRPADALVYLDGELLGTAGSLSQLDLPPGVYVLEVEHAELTGQRLVFGVDEEPLSVAIDLAADRPSRRSRVK